MIEFRTCDKIYVIGTEQVCQIPLTYSIMSWCVLGNCAFSKMLCGRSYQGSITYGSIPASELGNTVQCVQDDCIGAQNVPMNLVPLWFRSSHALFVSAILLAANPKIGQMKWGKENGLCLFCCRSILLSSFLWFHVNNSKTTYWSVDTRWNEK